MPSSLLELHEETLLVIMPTHHRGSMRYEYPPTPAHAIITSSEFRKHSKPTKVDISFDQKTGQLQVPRSIVREGQEGATCTDAGGDSGPAETLLLDNEAGADETAGEQRQD